MAFTPAEAPAVSQHLCIADDLSSGKTFKTRGAYCDPRFTGREAGGLLRPPRSLSASQSFEREGVGMSWVVSSL